MSGYDCRNKCVFSFRRNTVSDEAHVNMGSFLIESRNTHSSVIWLLSHEHRNR